MPRATRAVDVTVLPGPSAVVTALVGERSRRDALHVRRASSRARTASGEPLWESLSGWDDAVVAYESPRRLPATLRSLALHEPERPVAVCRELTKRFEEVVRGTAAELAERFAEPPKGEITLVLGPSAPAQDPADALRAVRELVAAGTPRRTAADVVARLSGVPRNDLYRGTL